MTDDNKDKNKEPSDLLEIDILNEEYEDKNNKNNKNNKKPKDYVKFTVLDPNAKKEEEKVEEIPVQPDIFSTEKSGKPAKLIYGKQKLSREKTSEDQEDILNLNGNSKSGDSIIKSLEEELREEGSEEISKKISEMPPIDISGVDDSNPLKPVVDNLKIRLEEEKKLREIYDIFLEAKLNEIDINEIIKYILPNLTAPLAKKIVKDYYNLKESYERVLSEKDNLLERIKKIEEEKTQASLDALNAKEIIQQSYTVEEMKELADALVQAENALKQKIKEHEWYVESKETEILSLKEYYKNLSFEKDEKIKTLEEELKILNNTAQKAAANEEKIRQQESKIKALEKIIGKMSLFLDEYGNYEKSHIKEWLVVYVDVRGWRDLYKKLQGESIGILLFGNPNAKIPGFYEVLEKYISRFATLSLSIPYHQIREQREEDKIKFMLPMGEYLQQLTREDNLKKLFALPSDFKKGIEEIIEKWQKLYQRNLPLEIKCSFVIGEGMDQEDYNPYAGNSRSTIIGQAPAIAKDIALEQPLNTDFVTNLETLEKLFNAYLPKETRKNIANKNITEDDKKTILKIASELTGTDLTEILKRNQKIIIGSYKKQYFSTLETIEEKKSPYEKNKDSLREEALCLKILTNSMKPERLEDSLRKFYNGKEKNGEEKKKGILGMLTKKDEKEKKDLPGYALSFFNVPKKGAQRDPTKNIKFTYDDHSRMIRYFKDYMLGFLNRLSVLQSRNQDIQYLFSKEIIDIMTYCVKMAELGYENLREVAKQGKWITFNDYTNYLKDNIKSELYKVSESKGISPKMEFLEEVLADANDVPQTSKGEDIYLYKTILSNIRNKVLHNRNVGNIKEYVESLDEANTNKLRKETARVISQLMEYCTIKAIIKTCETSNNPDLYKNVVKHLKESVEEWRVASDFYNWFVTQLEQKLGIYY